MNRHNLIKLTSGTLLPLMFILIFFDSCNRRSAGEKSIFRYNETSGIASLDPAFARNQSIMWAVHQLYSTLVEVDDSLHTKPLIAKSWNFSEDKKTVTFILRSDIYFHNDKCFGDRRRKLISADVVYSFQRLIDPKVASPGAWIFSGRVDSLQPFSAPDDTTFVLRMREPFQPILGVLSMQYCSVVPREAVETYGSDFRRHPVGSGPFMFVAWDEGQALILHKNENYFETDETNHRLPYLDGIKISFFDSKATEFLMFRQKEIDFLNDLDASFKDEMLTRSGNLSTEWQRKLQIKKHPYLNIEYFGVLMDSASASPLQKKKIRQAINYAIDRKKLVFYLRNSIGIPAEHGFIPAGMPGFTEDLKGYSFDPEKCRQLLNEAGYASGVNNIILQTIPQYANLATFAASELKRSGINVRVETVQKSLLLEMTAKNQSAFFRGSWIADYPDAENYLSLFYSKNPSPPNYTRFSNKEFDVLYERSLKEINDSSRLRLYRQMDSIIIDEAPVVPLWYDMVLNILQSNIDGFKPNSLNMLELRKVKKCNR